MRKYLYKIKFFYKKKLNNLNASFKNSIIFEVDAIKLISKFSNYWSKKCFSLNKPKIKIKLMSK